MTARLQADGWRVVVIDGRRCATKASLLAELAAALHFPTWFGRNWDALVDCLRDAVPATGSGLALVISHPRLVGAGEPEADVLATLTSIVDDLAAEGTRVMLAEVPSRSR
jgi:hypothetical protein